jgi:hypothetical protein
VCVRVCVCDFVLNVVSLSFVLFSFMSFYVPVTIKSGRWLPAENLQIGIEMHFSLFTYLQLVMTTEALGFLCFVNFVTM